MRSRHCTTVNSREQPLTWNGAEPKIVERVVVAAVEETVAVAGAMVEAVVATAEVVVAMVVVSVAALEEEGEEVFSSNRDRITMTVSRIAQEVR